MNNVDTYANSLIGLRAVLWVCTTDLPLSYASVRRRSLLIRSVVFHSIHNIVYKTNDKDVKCMSRKQVQLHEPFSNKQCLDVHVAITFP